jgi:tricorn protease
MIRPQFRLLAVFLLLVTAGIAWSQEPIRFARTPDISPDGKLVAFSYLGDIWIVETIGGVARPVTMHTAHEIYPVFSPDGQMLAFSSNRHGSYDVFVVPVQGGKPKRLTTDSANDFVNGWTPDGKNILFTSTRSTAFPPGFDLYTVPVAGGAVRKVSAAEGKDGTFAPKGDLLAYTRGAGTWYRKGYRGSANDDIWICNADGTNNRQFTHFNGQDGSPMWGPDGQFVYYVSEYHGTPANIVRQDIAGKTEPQLVTFHKDDAVRRARISRNGQWIVYECGADLWVVSTREGHSPRKLAIEVHADDKTNTEAIKTFTDNAGEFALSWDEKHVAFSVHGQLFLMPMAGPPRDPTRLTDSPAYDHGMTWSPDGQKIVFASDRNGHENLYLLEPNDPEHPKLVEAHQFKVTQLTHGSDAEFGAAFAPDGKRVAFIRAGKLWTMKPDGTDAKAIVNDLQVTDIEWSPDSKWLAFSRLDGSFSSELYIVPAGGGEARNVTRYATRNEGVTWSANGKKLGFISYRRQKPVMGSLSLQRPAAPDAPPSNDIDWEDIHLRFQQAAPLAAEEGAISPDGNRVAFRASENGNDLWVAGMGSLQRLTSGNMRPTQIQWARHTPDTLFFRDGAGLLRKVSLRTGDAGVVPFRVKMVVKRDDEFQEVFDQSWRALADHFYDAKYHGVDWLGVRNKYRPLVKHIALKEDLDALISLMMGELNASHLGITRIIPAPEETTADLGLLYDESYHGPGLKIAEILKRGPADRRGINLKPGDIILSIDKTPLTDNVELSKLLNDKVGRTVALEVTAQPADPKARRRVELQAASRTVIADLMYERWVEHNAKRVAELSKGKLGYIHIPNMQESGLDHFVRSLYSDAFDKEGIVLDVRYNGGGFTHDQVLNYLGAREHTVFRQRDGGEGWVMRNYDRKWTKPIVLLINNRSYSDAEIFPSAFRTLGLGKLVGEPTGGHVIGTSAINLIDGSMFRVPRTGVFTAKGINMEREGVVPDVIIEPHPDQIARGIDVQLDKAVEVVQQDVVAWKKAHAPVVTKTADGKPLGAAPPMPMAK